MTEDEARRAWFRREVIPLEPVLRACAKRLSHGSDEAEDLLHDVFARLMTYAGWREIESARAFALTVMKNNVIHAARRRKIVSIHVIAELDGIGVADDMPGADRVLEARDELRLLSELIRRLPPKCRQVFTLHKIYGLSHAQIAVRLGLSVSTVEKHVIKGLRFCSEHLLNGHGALSRPEPDTSWARQCKDRG